MGTTRKFIEFTGKFGFRVLRLVGIVAVVQSAPVKWMAGLTIWQWFGVIVLASGLVLELATPLPDFVLATRKVAANIWDQKTHLDLAVAAVMANDFTLAQKEYARLSSPDLAQVLGAKTDISEAKLVVYPNEKIEAEIDKLNLIIEPSIDHRDILLIIALKYWQLSKIPEAREYWQKARVLDPNNQAVKELGELLGASY